MGVRDIIIDYKPGMKITEPCIVRGIPIEVYHKMPALSNSGLKMLLDCPAKYYYKYLSGEYSAKEKPAFKIGKACHCYILEGKEKFEQNYWHNPYSDYTKTELLEILREKCRLLFSSELKFMPLKGRSRIFNYYKLMRLIKSLQAKYGINKSLKDYLLADIYKILFTLEDINSSGIELTKNELNQVIGTARAIKANKHASAAFSQKGESELSIFWQDEESGLQLKCRPDFLPYDCEDIPDYKTCASVNPETFYKDFLNYGYHIQAAMYREGIKSVTGKTVQSFFFVAQEKEPPYITQVYIPDMALIEHGRKAVKNALEVYSECEKTGIWKTFSDKVIELTIQDKPEELMSNFDPELGCCYAPKYIDTILQKYEVIL